MSSLKQSQPWLGLGISRATWFRRQKEKGAPDGRTKAAQVRAAPPRARPMRSGETAEAYHARIGNGRFVGEQLIPAAPSRSPVTVYDPSTTVHRPPMTVHRPPTPPPASRSMFAIGGAAGKGLIPQGNGYAAPPDIAAVSTYTHAKQFEANATASINLLAREVASLKREVAELKEDPTADAKRGAQSSANEPAWHKILMVAAMGVQAYAAMCQAVERDRRETRQGQS
jgi:hypothetical protein